MTDRKNLQRILFLLSLAFVLAACGKEKPGMPAFPTREAPPLSDRLSEEIRQDWQRWEAMSREAQAAESRMRGSLQHVFFTWQDAVDYLGFAPWNPLEEADWLSKKNMTGTDVIRPGETQVRHAELHFSGDKDGSLSQVALLAGYTDGDVRVILTAEMIRRGTYSEDPGKTLSLSESISAKETWDDGDLYQAVNLYFDRENVFYSVRLIAPKSGEGKSALEASYQRLLDLVRQTLDLSPAGLPSSAAGTEPSVREAFPDAYVPDEKEQQFWWPQYGELGPDRTYQRLEFSTNVQREIFPEAAADTQSLLALSEAGHILWRRELPYKLGNMISLKEGVAVSGTVWDEDALLPRTVYVESYGLDGERRWQWQADNPDGLSWTLLAAQEEDEGVRCLFHAYSFKKDLSFIKNMLFDEKGELLSARQADIGTRSVFGGALYGKEAILILPGSALTRMDAEGALSEAVTLPPSEGEELSLDGIAAVNGKLYVSLTFRRRPATPESDSAVRSWEDLAYGEIRPSETLTESIRSQYRAELREAPVPAAGLPAVDQFRTVYGREKSLGGRLSADENGVLCWDIREPFDLYPAPWADSFSIGGSCRILRYSYDSEGVGRIMPTDRITGFRLLN